MGNVDDPAVLWAWTVRHVERLIEELQLPQRPHHRPGRPGRLEGRRLDRRRRRRSRPRPTGSTSCSTPPGWPCGGPACPHGTATHLHVLATELRRGKGFQLSLFDAPDPKREAVAAAKAAVNDEVRAVQGAGRDDAATCRRCTPTRPTTSTSATCGARSASDPPEGDTVTTDPDRDFFLLAAMDWAGVARALRAAGPHRDDPLTAAALSLWREAA